jgi:DNA-directed RNA polymerase sigma subunit (sigma70/sigma32)
MFCITGHFKDTLCEDYMTNRTLHRSAGTTRKAPVHLGEQTEKVLSTLAPREEMILRMRFGIGQKASTLEELSQQFSLTGELLRQIEVQALRKVRERTRSIYPRAIRTFSTRGHATSTRH